MASSDRVLPRAAAQHTYHPDDPNTPVSSAYSRFSFMSDLTMTETPNDEDSLMYSEEGQHTSTRMEDSDTSDCDEPAGRSRQRKQQAQPMQRRERNSNLHHAKSSFRPDKGAARDQSVVKFPAKSPVAAWSNNGGRDEENPSRSSKRLGHTLTTSQGGNNNNNNNRNSKKEASRNRHHHRQHRERVAGNWMTQLAYSFRSPSPRSGRKDRGLLQDYSSFVSASNTSLDHLAREESPLLQNHTNMSFLTLSTASPPDSSEKKPPQAYVSIAAAFLRDYEANRPPTFAARRLEDITKLQVRFYWIRYGSLTYSVGLTLAALALFMSSFLEGFANPHHHRVLLTLLNTFALVVYGWDLGITQTLRGTGSRRDQHRYFVREMQKEQELVNGLDHVVRQSRSEAFIQPLILFGIMLAVENTARLIVTPGENLVLFSSLFKPLIFYYVSSRARDAMEVLGRLLRGVIRVLLMEMLIILMFAVVACRLYNEYEGFRYLSTAWLSLFKLSTTIVNPGIWMPMYESSKTSALFFISFVMAAVFYMHCLVLGVVFETHIEAAADVRRRSAGDREDCLKLAFLSLRRYQNKLAMDSTDGTISIFLVRETLKLIRPHYNAMKINALVEIIGPSSQVSVDYLTFRNKIRQALNASIRTTRNASPVAMATELVAAIVAIVNFVYVILVSSVYSSSWFDPVQDYIACGIALGAALELLIRFNPFRIRDFTPLTRLNATFDGIAVAAALISCYGMGMFFAGRPSASHYILIGRAIDMIRVMRFFQSFRDLVRRSSDVLPVLLGPVILVVTTLHIFVYAGMALWGGTTSVGSYGVFQVQPGFDLNNFNSYQEGLVTMFQVLVVNDWDQLAQVFLVGSHNSSPFIVYTFFVIAILVGVSIMMNVLIAFFVEAFVTKFNNDTDAPADLTATVHKDSPEFTPSKKQRSKAKSAQRGRKLDNDSDHDADSEGSSASEIYEFDVYEREGFNKIMQTVAGSNDHNDFGRLICSYLEVFESLSPGREPVGWLVCDQQTLDRFGNQRFETKAVGFLKEKDLQAVVSNMHSELLALAPRASFQDNSLIRRFPHKDKPSVSLEIAAKLLRRHPALSLFVCREVEQSENPGLMT